MADPLLKLAAIDNVLLGVKTPSNCPASSGTDPFNTGVADTGDESLGAYDVGEVGKSRGT